MATSTKKTTTRKRTTTTAAKKPAAVPTSKASKVLDYGTATSLKTKYHFMCVVTIVFAVICGILFWALCNKQSEFDDFVNCVAEDANCTVPNKRADKKEKGGDTSYYDGSTVEENAIANEE